jgi:hypothetical protein
VNERVRSGRPSAFALIHFLSTPSNLPREARTALDALKKFIASKGGVIRRSELPQLDDDLARMLGHSAVRHRVFADAINRGPPFPWGGRLKIVDFLHQNLEALLELEAKADPPIRPRDLDEAWFAAYYTRILSIEAFRHQRGPDGRPASTSAVVRSCQQELVRAIGIDEALEDGAMSPAKKKALLEQRDDAVKKALLAAFTVSSDAEGLERAADMTDPAVRRIYRAAAARISPEPLGPTPEDADKVLAYLKEEGLYGLIVDASLDPARALGPLPGLARTTLMLEQRGLLDWKTFADLVIRLRSHALPSFEQLIEVMRKHGMRNYEVDASKGASANQLTLAAIGRAALSMDSSRGDSWLSPRALARRMMKNARSSLAEAKRRNKPLLMLGEGYATARAFHEASLAFPGVRKGYVAFTQSGLNFLREQRLRFFVESLADALLKKLTESRPLGAWAVDRELELRAMEGSPPPEKLTAVVVGYGASVGPGIARALRERGFGRIIVVDVDPSSLNNAKSDGFTDLVLRRPGDGLPSGDVYFTAAGQPDVIDERALRSMRDEATVVIQGSSVESDKHFIYRALKGRVRGVRARALEEDRLPDHRTLEIAFSGPSPTRVRLRKMGRPFYDGRLDKDRLLVDVYMSGLLAALAVAANRLKQEAAEGGRATLDIRTLEMDLQRAIARCIEESYGVDPMTSVTGQPRRD